MFPMSIKPLELNCERERERETERERDTERETERQRERQIQRERDRERERWLLMFHYCRLCQLSHPKSTLRPVSVL